MVNKHNIMKNFILILISLVLLTTNISCYMFLKDDELSLQKKPYNGNELKIDGYYYQIYDSLLYSVSFFYNNGCLLTVGSGYNEEELGINLKNENWTELFKKNKSWWGLFEIEQQTIKFERWFCDGNCKTYVRAGEIINDTTFVITESYRMLNGEITEYDVENITFHFKKFSPKPDSTNSFIP